MASSPHTYPPATQVPVRKLNLHEAQSANIMRDHGVNTPKGGVAKTPEEAYKVLCVCACVCVCVCVVCVHTHTLRRQDF